MKEVCILFFEVLVTASTFAQIPQKMSYQAIIRNASNTLVTSHAVGMRISILLGSAYQIHANWIKFHNFNVTNKIGVLTHYTNLK